MDVWTTQRKSKYFGVITFKVNIRDAVSYFILLFSKGSQLLKCCLHFRNTTKLASEYIGNFLCFRSLNLAMYVLETEGVRECTIQNSCMCKHTLQLSLNNY